MTAPYRTQAFTAAGPSLHALVIGGGIGGLCLAQGLKRAGVSVAVYERDRALTDRLQGYRVHINPAGSSALHACLPPDLFGVFDRTCGKPVRAMHFLDEQMRVLLTIDGNMVEQQDQVAKHRSVSRITLRQVLLSGLDDIVHLGKTFTRYEELSSGRIVAYFEDGTLAEGDVLVAADGGGSRVRRQFLPHAERIDTGVVGIAGKVFLDDASRARIAPVLLDGMALVAAKGGLGLFVALQELSGEAGGGIGGNDTQFDGGSLFDNTRSYLMWALSGRRDGLDLDGEQFDSAALASEASGQRGNTLKVRAPDTRPEPGSSVRAMLAAAAARAMGSWAPGLRDLVGLSDPSTISCIPIRTSRTVAPWPAGRVTLIGDAIHAMTPYRGIGANIALKDAVRLRDALVAAQRGERPLLDAIGGYEAAMRDYGFKAVGNSLKAMEQTTGQGPIVLALSRSAMRLIDKLPPVKRMMAKRMGDE